MIKWNSVKGYVLVVISGLFFLAVAMLIIGNIKNYHFNLWCFWTILYSQSVGVVLLITAGVGIVAVWMLKLLVRGVRDIMRGRKAAVIDKIAQLEKAQSKNQTS